MTSLSTNKKFYDSSLSFQRNYLIDVLKTFAIIFVLWMHVPSGEGQHAYLGYGFFLYWAIPLFFTISGITWSQSYKRNNVQSIADAFKLHTFCRRLLKFVIPWFIIFLLTEIIYMSMYQCWDINFFQHLILGGGMAYGNYYMVLVFQLLILFPIFYVLIDKYKFNAVIGFYIFNILFELVRWASSMPIETYTYMLFRYTSFIAFGTWLGLNQEQFSFKDWKKTLILFLAFTFGCCYTGFIFYSGYKCQFFYVEQWQEANFLSVFYILPIVYVLYKKVKIKHQWWGFIGKKSYGIYLFQMMFLTLVPRHFAANNDWLQGFISISICVVCGIVYEYLASDCLTKWIIKKYDANYIKKKNTN